MINIATNTTYQENSDDKHSKNVKFGWYRCTVRFTLPTCDDKGDVIGKNAFQGKMIIRFDDLRRLKIELRRQEPRRQELKMAK